MKVTEKELKKHIKQFKSSLKNLPCSIKHQVYWNLLEECLNNDETIEFVREKWRLFTNERIKMLEKKLGIK